MFGGGNLREKMIPESVTAEVVASATGSPLARMIERLGGYSGTVTDMFDQEVPVSLEKWRAADPETTKVVLKLRYEPRR
jgi:hypothetical protein